VPLLHFILLAKGYELLHDREFVSGQVIEVGPLGTCQVNRVPAIARKLAEQPPEEGGHSCPPVSWKDGTTKVSSLLRAPE
jgi:hypothetical protein